MPYCTRCGSLVLDADRFCSRCGAPQQAELRGAPREPKTVPATLAPGEPKPGAEPTPPGEGPPPPKVESPPPEAAPLPGPGAPTGAGPTAPGNTIRPHIAAMLCYLPGLGWIAAVIFLTLDPYRMDRYVRFHAFQGLYLTVVWVLARVFFFPFAVGASIFPFLGGVRRLVQLAVIVAQVLGIVKTLRKQQYRVPVLGELAEKSLA